jgi:hypothetical protein
MFAAFIAAALAGALALAAPSSAAAVYPPAAVTADFLEMYQWSNPEDYAEIEAAFALYGADQGDYVQPGAIPSDVVATFNAAVWVAVVNHANAINQNINGDDPDIIDMEERIGPIVTAAKNFVKNNWSKIKNAAVKSGKWAWWKAHLCSGGAINSLYNWSGGNPAMIGAYPKEALAVAIQGCIRAL